MITKQKMLSSRLDSFYYLNQGSILKNQSQKVFSKQNVLCFSLYVLVF